MTPPRQSGTVNSSLTLRPNARAAALVIVTEWEQFRALDIGRLKKTMAQVVVVDLRNIYRADDIMEKGFSYCSVGRGKISQERS